ncbi:DUF3558 domain-containing protein, partial [Mycobacterium sp. ITM-2017-0098]
MNTRFVARICAALTLGALVAGGGTPDRAGDQDAGSGTPTSGEGFRSVDCNGVNDADVEKAAGPG